jgi:hypothetical protein
MTQQRAFEKGEKTLILQEHLTQSILKALRNKLDQMLCPRIWGFFIRCRLSFEQRCS